MIFWLLPLVSLVAFGYLVHRWDGLAVPAWQSRNAYRLLAFLLVLSLFLLSYKTLSYREEVRALVAACRDLS